jgi:hypothetical protein
MGIIARFEGITSFLLQNRMAWSAFNRKERRAARRDQELIGHKERSAASRNQKEFNAKAPRRQDAKLPLLGPCRCAPLRPCVKRLMGGCMGNEKILARMSDIDIVQCKDRKEKTT